MDNPHNGSQLFFTSYQAGENNDYHHLSHMVQDLGGRMHKVWDGEDAEILREVAGVSPEQINKFYNGRIDYHTNGSQHARQLNERPPLDTDSMPDVWCLMLFSMDAEVALRNKFSQWLAWIVEEAANVGGDDSTYDYYPDLWFVTHQIAEALNLQEVYTIARTDLLASTRYGEDDLPDYIPSFDNE